MVPPTLSLDLTQPTALVLLLALPVFVAIDRATRRARTGLRRTATLAIRLLAFTLLVLALANPVIWTGSDRLATVFLLDRSASVTAATQQSAVDWINRALQAKPAMDRAAVVTFAGNASIEVPLTAAPVTVSLRDQLDVDHTNLADGLRVASGVLPPGGARRIVLLSDGNENQGNGLQATEALRAAGIPVDVVPLEASRGPEVVLRNLGLPDAIHKGEKFTLNVAIDSTVETEATVRILVDGKLDASQKTSLHVGNNSLVLGHDPLSPGEHSVEALVEPVRDTVSENNVAYGTLLVAGPPRVLLVEGDPGAAKYLAPALRLDGLSVDVAAPSILSGDVASLRQYDSIGLVNVPAPVIGASGLLALQSYVRDFGGGLVAIGGDRSFGVGGYRKTPLEETLPVTTDVRGRAAHTSVALVLVIDTSGSMSEGPTGATKIDLARQAAAGAVGQLDTLDQIGILAFDDQNHWIYPLQFLTDRATVDTSIAQLQPGGGTAIYPAVQAAYEAIVQRPAKVKHILLMTDGLAPNGDYEGLTAQMRKNGVTLSTIAIGTDADANLLQSLADWGRGRFYDATNPIDVPRFVLKETTEIARAAITEETFTPAVVDQSPALAGITAYAPLYGYVATTPKPSALVDLASPEHDPILAQWQYGLGRSMAFTSDVSARWSSAWASWAEFSRFWNQVFRWTVPSPQGQSLQIQTTVVGDRARIVVDSIASDGRYVNDAPTTATVAAPPNPGHPNATPRRVALVQTAPGRYSGETAADRQGSYLVEVSQNVPGQVAPATQVHGFTVPYPPEFDARPTDYGLLRELARRTGGAVLSRPDTAFSHNLRLADSAQPIWPYIIAALIPLFLLDVAVRRLRFSAADLAPVVERLKTRWAGQSERATHFATRLAASRHRTPPLPPAPARPVPRLSSNHPRPPPAPSISRPVRPPPLAARAPTPAAGGSAPATGSRLLAAKRRATPAAKTGG